MRPLPEKYHGLTDMETRYRQRYVDLIVTPRAREIFFKRSLIVREFRRFMEDHGFMRGWRSPRHTCCRARIAETFRSPA